PEGARPAERAAPVKLGPFPDAPGSPVNGVALTADGKSLASAHLHSQLKLWDLDSRKEMATVAPPAEIPLFVDCVAFSPDGKTLASGGDERTVRLWDVAAKKEKAVLQETVVVCSVAFSPGGQLLASGGRHSVDKVNGPKIQSGEIQKLE